MNELPPKMRVCISSPPDRENLVAEIFYEGAQWAELNPEASTGLTVEIYPRRHGQPWSFPLPDALAALQIAKRRLCGESD